MLLSLWSTASNTDAARKHALSFLVNGIKHEKNKNHAYFK